MSKYYSISPAQVYDDHRGAVVYPFRDLGADPVDMKNMHVASIAPGEIRGNHYHPMHVEYVLITGVELVTVLVSPDGEKESFIIGPSPTLVTLKPGVAHAFRNEGDFPCFLTCWYSGGGEEVTSESKEVME